LIQVVRHFFARETIQIVTASSVLFSLRAGSRSLQFFQNILKLAVMFKLLIALMVLVTFTACTGRQTVKSTELRFGFTSEPTTLDPLNPRNTADGRSILFNVFEGLVKPDVQGRLQGCVAESWTMEQGGLVYDFIIREGIIIQ